MPAAQKTGRTAPLGSIDPDIKIPAAVARATELANAAYKKPELVAPVEPAPAPAPEVIVEPAPAPAPPQLSPESWEHKFNSMKGRFEREERQNKANSERINGLESTIAAMAVTTPAPAEMQASSLLTPKEVVDYGEEFLDVVKRQAKASMTPEVASLKKQVDDLNARLESVGGHVAKNERDQMNSDLTTAIPNWLEVNENERFLNWLALQDPFSGAIRGVLLKEAYAKNQTSRVLAFFKGFLAEEAAVTPRDPAPEPAPVTPAQPRLALADLAAPGRAKTAAAHDAPAEKPSFTRAQVTRFYTDVSAGRYAGKDAERLRIDREISVAGREGRIT